MADTLSFLLGGFHTSGLMFTWMLWYLADHPESQDRLRAEIDQETGGGRGDRLKEYVLRNDTYVICVHVMKLYTICGSRKTAHLEQSITFELRLPKKGP